MQQVGQELERNGAQVNLAALVAVNALEDTYALHQVSHGEFHAPDLAGHYPWGMYVRLVNSGHHHGNDDQYQRASDDEGDALASSLNAASCSGGGRGVLIADADAPVATPASADRTPIRCVRWILGCGIGAAFPGQRQVHHVFASGSVKFGAIN